MRFIHPYQYFNPANRAQVQQNKMSMELRARKPYAGSEDEISINETTDSSLTAMETANKNQTLERFDEDNLTLGEDERPFYLVEPAYKVETFTPRKFCLYIFTVLKADDSTQNKSYTSNPSLNNSTKLSL